MHLPNGVTRVEWTCRCGHVSYKDITSSCENVEALGDDLRQSKILRCVTITTKRRPLVFEWASGLRNAIISSFVQHPSGNAPKSRTTSSGLPESSSTDSQSTDLRRKQTTELFLHVCVDKGGPTCLEVIQISARKDG